MWISVAAITRNSPATSRFSSCISCDRVEVLLRDQRDRDVVDVHLVLPDEVQQQIERPLEVRSSLTGKRVGRRLEVACWLRPMSSVAEIFIASRTRSIVSPATARARFEPSNRISFSRSGFASTAARRSRIGSRCAFSALASLVLTSTSPTLPGAIARLQVVDFGRVRVERVVIDEHRIAFDGARDVGADALRIGVHPHALSSSPRPAMSDR